MTGKKYFKMVLLLLLIVFATSLVFAVWAESMTCSIDSLMYTSKSYRPVQTIGNIRDNTILLEPYKNIYTDEASFNEYLDRLDAELSSLEEYVGITNTFIAPAGIQMYYKEGEIVRFETRHLGGGENDLVPVDWDHNVTTAEIVLVDNTLIKLGVIPELDEEMFGRSYLITDEIPVLVGGKNAKNARVGEVYQAVLYPRRPAGNNGDSVASGVVISTKITGIADTPIAIAEMVNKGNQDIVIMPPVINEDGKDFEQSLPSTLKIMFKETTYEHDTIRIEGAAEVLEVFGRPSPDLQSHLYTLRFFYDRLHARDYLIYLITAIIMGIFTVIILTELVKKIMHKYLEKTSYRIIISAVFPVLCFLVAKRFLFHPRFLTISELILNSLANFLNLEGLIITTRYISSYVLSRDFANIMLMIPLAVLALSLVFVNIFPARTISTAKWEKAND
jgi:hypothetical protein